MPAVWLAIVQFALFVIVPLATRLLTALGVGFVTYQGVGAVFDELETKIFAQFSGMPETAYQILVLAGFDHALNIILSAMSAALVLKGMSAIGNYRAARLTA